MYTSCRRIWPVLVGLALLAQVSEMEAFLRPASAYPPLFHALQRGPLKVSVVGSGNWGTAVAKIVAENAKRSYIFNDDVRIWVLEEDVQGQKLTEWINKSHENRKYLPGITLPQNLRAIPSLVEACAGADMLVFVLPHQFVQATCRELGAAGVLPDSARAVSLIKGLSVKDGKVYTMSTIIGKALGIARPCVLSGANVANDIAKGDFAEATIGYEDAEAETARIWQSLFDTPNFKVNVIPDISGVEVCGALKNVMALAGGFCDGMNLGTNTKAALIRIGVEEMKAFALLFFDDLLADTLFDSAGYADVITTVFGGRNAKCAAEFVRNKGQKSWEAIEAQMLNGQKLQGTLTVKEVVEVIRAHNAQHVFPLFMAVHQVAFEGAKPEHIVEVFRSSRPRALQRISDCVHLKVPSLIADMRKRIRLQSEFSGTS